jgi:hypothetical protein
LDNPGLAGPPPASLDLKHAGRTLGLLPRPGHVALPVARLTEGSQAVRAFGLRQACYRDLARSIPRHIATTAAASVLTLDQKTARFAALAA